MRKRFTEEQKIRVLKEHEAGRKVKDLIREHQICEQTFYKWKSKYGGMEVTEAKRLKSLEDENRRLKRLLAERDLEVDALKIVLSKKLLKPCQRKEVVREFKEMGMSERRSCRITNFHRSSFRYKPVDKTSDRVILSKLKELALKHVAYGLPRLTVLLRRELGNVNHKRIERIYRQNNLQIPKRPRKKRLYRSESLPPAEYPTQRWSMDFVGDRTVKGRPFRIFNIMDDFSRELVLQIVDTSITGSRLNRELSNLKEYRNLPENIVCDNGPEFRSKAMSEFSLKHNVKLCFIPPGEPQKNAFVESLNGKFRNECLNQSEFLNLNHARNVINEWRESYNNERPHSSLNMMSPKEYLLTYENGIKQNNSNLLNLDMVQNMG